MKTSKFLTIVFVSIIACTASVYAQSNINKSSNTVTKKTEGKSVSNKAKDSSSSNASLTLSRTISQSPQRSPSSSKESRKTTTPNSYQSTSTSRGSSEGQTPSRDATSSSSSRKTSAQNASQGINIGRSRLGSSTSTRDPQTTSSQRNSGSGINSSRSNAYRGNEPANRNQGVSMNRGSEKSPRQKSTANINHSRERLIQRIKNSTPRVVDSPKSTPGNWSTTSSTATLSGQSRASNFVYSPHSNCVMKMRPSSGKSHTSPRQVNRSGLWDKCENNKSVSHSTRLSQVQAYAIQNLNMNIIDYGFSGGLLYMISKDSTGVFLQACNKDGKVLDEQKITQEYTTIVTNEENSGCWIMKKNEEDPLYYGFDGVHLLKYDPDENIEIIDFNFCEMVTYTISRENQHTYFQIYSDTSEQPLASTEINDNFNTIDVETTECRCYIKDIDNKQSVEVVWLGYEIMMVEGE